MPRFESSLGIGPADWETAANVGLPMVVVAVLTFERAIRRSCALNYVPLLVTGAL